MTSSCYLGRYLTGVYICNAHMQEMFTPQRSHESASLAKAHPQDKDCWIRLFALAHGIVSEVHHSCYYSTANVAICIEGSCD